MPSRFEKNVVRTLSNPNGEPRTQHARTPHHLLNGTITPNGLHFVISHGGDAGHRSGQAPPGDPRPRQAAAGLHARGAGALSDGVAHDASSNAAATARRCFPPSRFRPTCRRCTASVSCAEWTGVKLSTLLEETGIDPKAKWFIAEGADAPHLTRSVPLAKALDDAMIALYQNGERHHAG